MGSATQPSSYIIIIVIFIHRHRHLLSSSFHTIFPQPFWPRLPVRSHFGSGRPRRSVMQVEHEVGSDAQLRRLLRSLKGEAPCLGLPPHCPHGVVPCAQCLWWAHGADWKRECPWLSATMVGDQRRIGWLRCSAPWLSKRKGAFGSCEVSRVPMLQRSTLAAHAERDMRKNASRILKKKKRKS